MTNPDKTATMVPISGHYLEEDGSNIDVGNLRSEVVKMVETSEVL